jgi:hypothetical protein
MTRRVRIWCLDHYDVTVAARLEEVSKNGDDGWREMVVYLRLATICGAKRWFRAKEERT